MQKLRSFSFDMDLMREYPQGWKTSGTAVPIMTKLKVIPNLPQVNGQAFLAKELATPAWDVTFKLRVDEAPTLKNLKSTETADIFACWFLLSDPHVRQGSIANNMGFGFRETFNGVGVFVIKEGP